MKNSNKLMIGGALVIFAIAICFISYVKNKQGGQHYGFWSEADASIISSTSGDDSKFCA